MRMTRFEPFRVSDLLQRDFGQISQRERGWRPAADVVEYADTYLLRLDVPGVAAGDIDLSTERGVLTISGERRLAELGDDASLTRQERQQGRFERQFTLPETSDVANIRAQSRDGILEVRIPKLEEVQARKITVEAA